ncbi:ribosome rescue protein RqcH [[Eubacterium] cellulosolvens]
MKKKTQLSSVDIIVLARELRETLIGGFIDKIYKPGIKDFMIRITLPKAHRASEDSNAAEGPKYQQINLVIQVGKFVYTLPKSDADQNYDTLTRSKRPPGPFAMLLRKHLKNAKITNIYQHEFDRIVVFELEKKETFLLILELFGDGNLILVRAGKIIQPLFSQTWSYRSIRAGEAFKFPPARVNPLKLKEGELCNILNASKKDLVRALVMDLDIPGIYAEELCIRAELDKNVKANQITNDDCIKLFEHMLELLEKIQNNPTPILIYKDDSLAEAIDFVPIKLELYDDYHKGEMKDYNSVIRKYFEIEFMATGRPEFLGKTARESISTTKKIAAERARLLRQLVQQKAAIEKFTEQIEYNKNLGEAIYSNYLRCEEVLNEIERLRTEVPPEEMFEHLAKTGDIQELNPHEGYVILSVAAGEPENELDIKLDLRKNVMENANSFYEQSKQQKEKLHGAQKALKITEELLAKLDKQDKIQKTKPEPKRRIVKNFWFERYHWLITSKGNIVVGGRDAKTNDQVVKKHLKDRDRYCHADISGAASVVIKHKPEDDEIPPETLEEACKFAVIYSKAWNAKVGAASAYWVKPDQVSKTPQSGEFLARGAFVVRGKRNYIGNIKLDLAIGELEYQGRNKLMAGPVEAVKTYANRYVVLAPGNIKKNEMAKELSKLFNISVDDVLSILPSGEFTLVKKVGFGNQELNQ